MSSRAEMAAAEEAALKNVAMLEKRAKESPKQANDLQTLLGVARNNLKAPAAGTPSGSGPSMRLAVAAMQALKRVFLHYGEAGQISLALRGGAAAEDEGAADEQGRPAKRARKGAAAPAASKALGAVMKWVRARYDAYLRLCLASLHHADVPAQLSALAALMDLARAECRPDPATYFMSGIFSQVVAYLVAHPAMPEALAARFLAKYAACRDVRFFLLRCLLAASEPAALGDLVAEVRQPATSADAEAATATAVRNMLQLLTHVTVDKDEEEAAEMDEEELAAAFFVPVSASAGLPGPRAADSDDDADDDDEEVTRAASGKRQRSALEAQLNGHVKTGRDHARALSDCWLAFLRLPLPADVYKKVLARMHQQIMPCVSKPLALSDFLTDSYNLGGVASLLALNGLFVLITEHNLDYPEFYPKLYRLIKPQAFHTKYRARFFVLLGTFLKSTHLPAYLVAAFVKRMARVALSAPPSGTAFMLVLIYNMLRRHPSCNVLLHRPLDAGSAPSTSGNLSVRVFAQARLFAAGGQAAASAAPGEAEAGKKAEAAPAADQGPRGRDPFVEAEDDPSKCRAMESSLWELRTLCNHYCPLVSRSAKVFGTENAPKQDYTLTDHSEHTYESILQREMAWRANQVMPLAYQRPSTLFDSATSCFEP